MSLINQGPSIVIANNDGQAIEFINGLSGATFSNITDALAWVSAQDDVFVQNRSMEDIVTDGLIFYLDGSNVESYPRSGSTWYDLSGLNNNATLNNNPTYGYNSIVFSNLENGASLGAFDMGQNGAHSIWFKFNEDALTGSSAVLLGEYNHYILYSNNGTPTNSLYHFIYYNDTGAGLSHEGLGDLAITVGKWYNVTVTWDDTGRVKFFADGVKIKDVTVSNFVSWATNYTNFNISGYKAETETGVVCGYNRFLSDEEILYNYNIIKSKYSSELEIDLSNDNSYLGEPTTNIMPDPHLNGRFEIGNNWRTYQTLQYNSNSFFSIGTVSFVDNNIVTLSEVGRMLYTYDCVRPQTTGGGVVADTDYFIRKWGDNSFSIHLYNSSEDGSQGYINPETGTFKVHDSIAKDERIEINDQNFPTMWRGYPHKPNMGHVKEIVNGGGYEWGTNCMRIHKITLIEDTSGMAYGTNVPVTVGDNINVSYWARMAGGTPSATIRYSTYFGPGANAPFFESTLNGDWQRFSYTWVASATYNYIQYFFVNNGKYRYSIDLADVQVEINTHATKFTTTSRSATQSVVDLIGKNDIDVSDVSFNSDSDLIFDGTDDNIIIPHNNYVDLTGDDITLEAVVKPYSFGSSEAFIHKEAQYTISFSDVGGDGKISYADSSLWSYNTFGYHGLFEVDTFYHIVLVKKSGVVTIYVNGDVLVEKSFGGAISSTTNSLYLGSYTSSSYYHGEIPVVKLYDVALSEGEVWYNYDNLKDRFGI